MIDRRVLLLEQLAEATERVIEGAQRIQRHRQATAALKRDGRETTIAEELLQMMVSTQAEQVAARQRLKVLLRHL